MTLEAQEPLSVYIEIMEIDSETDETCDSEPIFLEEPAEIMEWSLVLPRDPVIGDLHGFQRFSMGNCGRPSHILRIMDTIRGKDEHKRQGTDDGLVCAQAKECDRTCGVSILVQHNHTIVRKEIRGNYVPRTARNSRENLIALLEDQYLTSNDLCSIKGAQGTNNHELSHINVEISHVVPVSDVPLCITTYTTAGSNSSTRSQKRKVFANGKQALELDGVEDQRSFLEARGLGTYDFNCIPSSERSFRRRSRYSFIQKRFLDWIISNEINTAISAPYIIYFLKKIYTVDMLKYGSIKTYKSPLLKLAENFTELSSNPMLAELTKKFDDASILSFSDRS
ncbi:hypothetical protein AYI70_g5459 [Smittium culicis]|nr:hypothetical protein AYI70_g5459 [Smittium culicis]